jgi:cell division septation protein DedD
VSDHEPSYYEIALTNRQVLIAFAILLVCLVAAFLAGVWVGRGDTPAPPARLAQEAPADAGDDEEGEPLSFFSGDAGEPAAAEPAAAPTPTTLAEDLGESAAAGEPEPPPAPAAGEAAAAARVPAARPPGAAEPAPPAAEPALAAGEVVIQVLSSRDRAQAQSMVERLLASGRDAYLSPVESGGQTLYRVRIGPFADRAQAQRVADEVRRQLKVDTWITPR